MSDRDRMLLVFDGGLAPGYTAVAVAMTEYAESRGYRLWAAREGFRSLVAGAGLEPDRIEPITSEAGKAAGASVEEAEARNLYGHIRDAGSPFRSERFIGFQDPEAQREAARFIIEQGFGTVVFAGGNGTLQGVKSLAPLLEPDVRIGFINASVDSDLRGDRSVGFLTALEEGARVARGLFADAMTHHRHYILEMMGNRGGKHALHCGIAARAHLIVLPQMDLSDETMAEIAAQLERRNHSLTVVAEGYCIDRRPEEQSASQYLLERLAEHGFASRRDRRVIAEPYSRYIRGVRPLAMENEAIMLKCGLLLDAFQQGESQIMPYYLSPHDLGVRHLEEVDTDNAVEPEHLDLIDRFGLESLRAHAHERYRG